MALVLRRPPEPFDLLVFDPDGGPLLAAEVLGAHTRRGDRPRSLLQDAFAAGIPYFLRVDPESLQLFGHDAPETPVLALPTRDLFASYAADLEPSQASRRFLVLLIDTWLRNVMQPLPESPPPALDRLDDLGVGGRLRDGEALMQWRGFF